MRSLSESAAALIIANALKYAAGVVLPMILVRLLNQHDYGTYLQLTLLANIGTGIMVLGLPPSIYYFYSRSHRPTLIAQTQSMLFVAGGIACTALVVFAPALAARMHNADLAPLLPKFASYVGLLIAGELSMHVLICQDRYRLEVGLELAETAVRVVVLAALLLLGYGLEALVAALIVYAAVRLLGRSYWLWTGPDSILKGTWSGRFPKMQLWYSVPLAASACVGMIGGLLDKIIVTLSFSPVDYAIYSVGALEVPLNTIFQASVANVLRASLSALIDQGRMGEVVHIWRESVRKLALVMIPSFAFLTVFAGRVIETLFTKHYDASIPIFHIYLLVIPLYMFILSAVPQVFGRTHINLYVSILTVAANALLSLVLLHVVGIFGPACAFACSSYLGSTVYLFVAAKLLKTKIRRLLPGEAIVRTSLAASIALVPAGLLAYYTHGLVSLMIGAISFTMVYFPIGYAVRALRPSDVETMRTWMRRFVIVGQPL
jgi:O-antigen/teichoic acid export membrane protein